jgi:FkbM family methyltransferase
LAIHINRLHQRNASQLEINFIQFLLHNFKGSQSQLFQDVLVAFLTAKKQNGFFVEFGATNGLAFSNTYMLEKDFFWDGILSEPAKIWHKELKANRNCKIEHRCVWRSTGEELAFKQTQIAELSTISEMASKDQLASSRIKVKEYLVHTISLLDLLHEADAPNYIDFLSIDTEGSEFLILNRFDFARYQFGIICVEHNFNELDRNRIYELLRAKGYQRVLKDYSNFDDWYINEKVHGDILALDRPV